MSNQINKLPPFQYIEKQNTKCKRRMDSGVLAIKPYALTCRKLRALYVKEINL